MATLCASIYRLPEPARSVPAVELWREMAGDVSSVFSEQYVFVEQWQYRICLKTEVLRSPDRLMVRYRTIQASIRRRTKQPTLLDLSVGNLFASASASPPEPLHIVNDAKYAKWARHAGQISLAEHIRLVRLFTEDLVDAGWSLRKASWESATIPPPEIRNGSGLNVLQPGKLGDLARSPLSWVDSGLDFAVVGTSGGPTTQAATQLGQALRGLFGAQDHRAPSLRTADRMVPGAVNLVLLDERRNLEDMPELREVLRAAEAAGVRFKLAKPSSLGNRFSARNIAYDMFVIAGGKPWMPAISQPAFCSMDAGHDKSRDRSRWVKVETDRQQSITKVSVFDTRLAEHVPSELVGAMWPSERNTIVCRDGKLSQERATLQARASTDGTPLVEVKKSPKAILWRESESGVRPAEFGDLVIDDHGEVLLQTVSQNPTDYVHPVRLSIQEGEPHEIAKAFLHQQAIPSLSLFRMSRLPGALYFSDLVSKLTVDGWPKAVGRGFNIAHIIP
jgi:hypothetical protein